VVVAFFAAVGCGNDPAPTFAAVVCPAVVDWSITQTRTVNAFTRDSRQLSDPTTRRIRYEEAFEQLLAHTEGLARAIAAAPTPGGDNGELVQAELQRAAADARVELADDLARARALPDTAYEQLTVGDGHLVTGTEKTFAILQHALFDTGEAHDHPDLQGECGHPAFETDVGVP